jgi:NAD(P)-dependent dehydrogenase (short-subunit alcohol dehydrogenase family)
MTRAMASEFGQYGITVNCVQPGATLTPMTTGFLGNGDTEMADYWRNKAALGRLGQPEDVADVIAFLLSSDARFVSGHGVVVDGATMQQP